MVKQKKSSVRVGLQKSQLKSFENSFFSVKNNEEIILTEPTEI